MGQGPRGVTLIGGWAVYMRVKPGQAQQSRDIDLVFHDDDTLRSFSGDLRKWNLQWRTYGRNRFNDCHLIGDDPANVRVDVMKSHDFEDSVFRGRRSRAGNMVKTLPTRAWLPEVHFLVQDKLETVPKRIRDRDDKGLKDLVDIHNLVFHNKDNIDSLALFPAKRAPMETVLPVLQEARAYDEEIGSRYEAQLEMVEGWLRRGLGSEPTPA